MKATELALTLLFYYYLLTFTSLLVLASMLNPPPNPLLIVIWVKHPKTSRKCCALFVCVTIHIETKLKSITAVSYGALWQQIS